MLGAIKSGLGLAWEALVVGGRAAERVLSNRRQGDNADPYFEPLTPVIVTDGRSARYERELLRALEHPDVLNIALTDSYGAGEVVCIWHVLNQSGAVPQHMPYLG